MNRKITDRDKQEKEKRILFDVWQLHIVEVIGFLNLLSRLCSFLPIVSDIIGICTVLLTLLFIVRLIMLLKGIIASRYKPHQIIITGFVIMFNAFVRLFVDGDGLLSRIFLAITLLSFAFYFWAFLWKGEIRREK